MTQEKKGFNKYEKVYVIANIARKKEREERFPNKEEINYANLPINFIKDRKNYVKPLVKSLREDGTFDLEQLKEFGITQDDIDEVDNVNS